VNYGEIWLVNLDPTIGAEIKKTRPAVIVNNDALGKLPLKIIVPITSWDDKFTDADWHVHIYPDRANGLSKESSADTFQVRSISDARLIKKLGKLDEKVITQIQEGLKISLNLIS
jgi:mRNA interferase MazF